MRPPAAWTAATRSAASREQRLSASRSHPERSVDLRRVAPSVRGSEKRRPAGGGDLCQIWRAARATSQPGMKRVSGKPRRLSVRRQPQSVGVGQQVMIIELVSSVIAINRYSFQPRRCRVFRDRVEASARQAAASYGRAVYRAIFFDRRAARAALVRVDHRAAGAHRVRRVELRRLSRRACCPADRRRQQGFGFDQFLVTAAAIVTADVPRSRSLRETPVAERGHGEPYRSNR